jgi:acetoin utilization deacetylase AcuC-like enzyme
LSYSVHESGIFPFTGEESNPAQHVYNLPLRAGHGDDELLGAVHDFIAKAKEFRAEYIFLAAGADGHVTDPLANLEYTPSGVRRAMEKLREAFPTTPILMGGAGGYQPDDETPNMWCAAVLGLITSGKSSRA